ncbi:unnamed protein product [Camellia sinensis]
MSGQFTESCRTPEKVAPSKGVPKFVKRRAIKRRAQFIKRRAIKRRAQFIKRRAIKRRARHAAMHVIDSARVGLFVMFYINQCGG